MKIYLAGAITGCTYAECTDWRERFADAMRYVPAHTSKLRIGQERVTCLSPMRGKDYLTNEPVIHHDYPEHVLSCQRGIMTRDFFDCTRVDLVVANLLGAKSVSIGTVMEIGWAFQCRTPVVAIMEEQGNPHDHPMVREAIGFRVTTVEEAVHIAKVILWP